VLPRTCVLTSAISLAIYLLSWFPPFAAQAGKIIFFQLFVMLLMFATFFLIVRHHITVWVTRGVEYPKVPFPLAFWVTLAVSFVFCMVNFFFPMTQYPEGSPIPSVILLRVFSSGWAFLLLISAAFAHWAGIRLRAIRNMA